MDSGPVQLAMIISAIMFTQTSVLNYTYFLNNVFRSTKDIENHWFILRTFDCLFWTFHTFQVDWGALSIASNPYQTFVHLLDFFDLGNDKCINIWRYSVQYITSTLGHSITSKPPPACQSPPSFDRGEQTCRSLFCPATMPPLPPMPSALRIDCYLIAFKKGRSVAKYQTLKV